MYRVERLEMGIGETRMKWKGGGIRENGNGEGQWRDGKRKKKMREEKEKKRRERGKMRNERGRGRGWEEGHWRLEEENRGWRI